MGYCGKKGGGRIEVDMKKQRKVEEKEERKRDGGKGEGQTVGRKGRGKMKG